jgi:hypothetical protein
MNYFQNEYESEQLGDLTIENRMDCVNIYGMIALKRTDKGLQEALALKSMIDDIIASIRLSDRNHQTTARLTDTIENPWKK